MGEGRGIGTTIKTPIKNGGSSYRSDGFIRDKRPLRVLVVDDHESVRHVVKKVLRIYLPELLVDTAANGAEALELFSEHFHHLVLSDLCMPVMDGEQFYWSVVDLCLKKRLIPPAYIFFSGYRPSKNVRKIIEENPQHCFFQKPINNSLLVDEVLRRLPVCSIADN